LPYIREDVNLELLRSLMGLWKQELAGWKERLEAVGKARFHARSRFNTRSCRDRGLCKPASRQAQDRLEEVQVRTRPWKSANLDLALLPL
jgi:hypothetical protein